MNQRPKTILVTGATGGIGSALCKRLGEAGHRLVLVARNSDRLNQACARLAGGLTSGHLGLVVDMTDEPSVARFAEELSEKGIVFDGAVLMPPQPVPSPDPMPPDEEWRTLFQRSFIGPLSLLKAAIGRMQPDPDRGRRAKVVIVSGISSVQVLSHYATSNVIRAAWLAQAKTMAFAMGEQGIHVNTLSLGGTLSPHYVGLIEKRAANAGVSFDDRLKEETANVPLRKYGSPAEAAVAIDALLSDFTDHITGTNILHDGGFTRAY